jgi:hypothetical protein
MIMEALYQERLKPRRSQSSGGAFQMMHLRQAELSHRRSGERFRGLRARRSALAVLDAQAGRADQGPVVRPAGP